MNILMLFCILFEFYLGSLALALNLCLSLSEATLTVLKRCDGLVQVLLAEVGPIGVAEIQLCVCDLPKQEIADAQLSARTDEQVGIGHEGGLHMTGDEVLRDVRSH